MPLSKRLFWVAQHVYLQSTMGLYEFRLHILRPVNLSCISVSYAVSVYFTMLLIFTLALSLFV